MVLDFFIQHNYLMKNKTILKLKSEKNVFIERLLNNTFGGSKVGKHR